MSYHPLSELFIKAKSDRVVAFSDSGDVNWQQFIVDIHSLISLLEQCPGQRVAICCDNSYLFSVALFACIYAKRCLVIPGNYQPAMLLSLSEQFDILIDDAVIAESTKQQLKQQTITLPIAVNDKANFEFTALSLHDILITLYTSGSTGQPKAIKKSLAMLDAEVFSLEKHFSAQLADTRILSTVSHQHIYGLLFRILWPLCAGRAFAVQNLIYPEQVVSCATSSKTLISSPALLKRLQVTDGSGCYSAIFSSGGPLAYQAAATCQHLFQQTPIEVFGSTETGGIGFRQQHQADSVWQFFSGVKASLGELDCLQLSSPWLSERTPGRDDYQTSDQCELLGEQRFRLKGRIDRIVKIEEKRVSLQEVETHINELKWVQESVVVVVNEPQRMTLGALLVLTEQGIDELNLLGKGRFWIKLRQALRDWLEPVAIPRHFRLSEEIPTNPQGKRLVKEIAELF